MKRRTIEEVHDRGIENRKFAKFIDMVIAEGYEIPNIRETNVMFKFKMNLKTQKKLDEMFKKKEKELK
jgi:hypothetical protein